MIVVLTGGTGGAKFVDGLRQVIAPEDLTVIVNTGDDLKWWGLHVSPDVDSILYVLADCLSRERGWGVSLDTFLCLQTMRDLQEPAWFQIGDRDLATHLLRTKLLSDGLTLTQATAEIAKRMGIRSGVLPMSDSPVATRVVTENGELAFEEYFVKLRHSVPVKAVRFAGAEHAQPAPGVAQAIAACDAVLIAPSNPVTSIGPMLAIPGIRQALRECAAPVVAISPIVSGAAVTGPAGALMQAHGVPVSLAGLWSIYGDCIDVLIGDSDDLAAAHALEAAGSRTVCTSILMRTAQDRVQLARTALNVALQPPSEGANTR
ncbi:MAG: 2-phospho-L-lactate transferase [Acidobacteriales bacterium]|nr:2-phospho-L-lactate transferase [Terriglobales bacterium]